MALAAMQPREVSLQNTSQTEQEVPQQPRLPSLAQLCSDNTVSQPQPAHRPTPQPSPPNPSSALNTTSLPQATTSTPHPQSQNRAAPHFSAHFSRETQPSAFTARTSFPSSTLEQRIPPAEETGAPPHHQPQSTVGQHVRVSGNPPKMEPTEQTQPPAQKSRSSSMPIRATTLGAAMQPGALTLPFSQAPDVAQNQSTLLSKAKYENQILSSTHPALSPQMDATKSFFPASSVTSSQPLLPALQPPQIHSASHHSSLTSSSLHQRQVHSERPVPKTQQGSLAGTQYGEHPNSAQPSLLPTRYYHGISRLSDASALTRGQLVEKRKTDVIPPPGSNIKEYCAVLTPFIYKLYCLVSDESTNDLCSWSENGDSFIVTHPTAFAATVLPNYFKHNQFSSFVRQLNKYRFHKLAPGEFLFGHERFIRGRPDLLPEIGRQRSPERVDKHNNQAVGPGGRTFSSLHPEYVKARNSAYRTGRDISRLGTPLVDRLDISGMSHESPLPYKRPRLRGRSTSPEPGTLSTDVAGLSRQSGYSGRASEHAKYDARELEDRIRMCVQSETAALRSELEMFRRDHIDMASRLKHMEDSISSMGQSLAALQPQRPQTPQHPTILPQPYAINNRFSGPSTPNSVLGTDRPSSSTGHR